MRSCYRASIALGVGVIAALVCVGQRLLICGTYRPQDGRWWAQWCTVRGWRNLQANHFGMAALYGECGFRIDPSWPHGYQVAALGWRGLGDKARSKRVLERGLCPTGWDTTVVLPLIEFEHGAKGYAAAEELLRKALDHHPSHPNLLVELAFVLLYQDRVDEAEVAVYRARGLQPDHEAVDLGLGVIRWHQHRIKEADELLSHASRRHQSYAPAQYWYGCFLARSSQPQLALTPLRRAVELEPWNTTYQHLLGDVQGATHASVAVTG